MRPLRQYFPASPAAAAVLVPIVDHEDGLSVLLTQRASHLKNHAGQISFPGGRIEAPTKVRWQAALRETEEEIGLSREHVTFAGYLEPHLVLTGFWVTPVVGFVQPGFALRARSARSRRRRSRCRCCTFSTLRIISRASACSATITVQVYDIPYGEHHIWGATAGMLMSLYRAAATVRR